MATATLKENKNGYKHSLNNLPKDWQMVELGKVFDIVNSTSFSRDNLTYEKTKNEIYNIHYGDLHATYESEILDFDIESRIPLLKDEFCNDKFNFLKNGDLIIADASEDYEGVGECIELNNIGKRKVIGGLHTIVLRDKGNNTSLGFRTYLFKTYEVSKALKKIATGISVYSVSKGNLSKLKLFLPPAPEQRAIAQLLSTWDKAITKTQALITQKELRKKWLMQQLLTGKKRLKGFKGEWKKYNAGDIFKNVSVKGFDSEELLSATQDKGIIPRCMLDGRVTMPTSGTESFKLVEKGDFVISLRSFQGGLEYSYYRGIVSPAYTVLKPKKKINEEFYKQYFKSYDFIGHLATAVIGIRDGKQISFDDFCIVKIPNPSFDEQTAIAGVLSSVDREKELLQQKLDKLKEQKKGLMQVLLTGKKRLKI